MFSYLLYVSYHYKCHFLAELVENYSILSYYRLINREPIQEYHKCQIKALLMCRYCWKRFSESI
jgi:hypothetical protein